MSDFDNRLKKAIERGARRSEAKARAARAKAMSEEELKSLHTKYRLYLSDHIERCVLALPQHFPGFRHETIYGERGWGVGCSRDDIGPGPGGKRENYYSRLEMTIRPFSSLHVLELVAKGTVRNKEVFSRSYFEKLDDADPETFRELIDVWVLEYAELYAART
jgi:hypothetical protein